MNIINYLWISLFSTQFITGGVQTRGAVHEVGCPVVDSGALHLMNSWIDIVYYSFTSVWGQANGPGHLSLLMAWARLSQLMARAHLSWSMTWTIPGGGWACLGKLPPLTFLSGSWVYLPHYFFSLRWKIREECGCHSNIKLSALCLIKVHVYSASAGCWGGWSSAIKGGRRGLCVCVCVSWFHHH